MGLIARFLICEPRSTMGTRFYREPPEQTPALDRYGETIRQILSRPLPLDAEGRLQPARLPLSPAAKARWVEYADAVERELPVDLEDVKDIAAKSAEQAARLAAVFHMLERGTDLMIDEAIMDRAVLVASWYLAETKRVLGLAEVSREEQNARALLRFLEKRGGPVWIKDITHDIGCRPIRGSAKVRDAAVDWLCDHGLARKLFTSGRTYVEAVR